MNPKHAELVGQIITSLPHIEEIMIAFLARLLGHPGGDDGPSRQVFRAITSEQARINVLRALLENAYINQQKPPLFDEVIDLFAAFKNTRNDYAHYLWFTHETGKVFIAPPSSDMKLVVAHNRREVLITELEFNVRRARELSTKINEAINWVDPRPIPVGWRQFTFRLTAKKKNAD